MDVFELRDEVITRQYAEYVQSFVHVREARLRAFVERSFTSGEFWPAPLVQLNPAFEPAHTVDELVTEGLLHPTCAQIFSRKDEAGIRLSELRLHRHQEDALRIALRGQNLVLTSGTGSGKSLAYLLPIVEHVLRKGSGKGIQAVVIYPMNALANSQAEELKKFLLRGFERSPVTFGLYTGQERSSERERMIRQPPDILLTNFAMLELVLTRPFERALIEQARGLRFIVLDELHTYRGRQGADVALLVRRLRARCGATEVLHIGTSATLATDGNWTDQRQVIARVATQLFGAPVATSAVVGETLRRITPSGAPLDLSALRASVSALSPPSTLEAFLADPLTRWIEETLGVEVSIDGPVPRLVRRKPQELDGEGAAAELSKRTGLSRGDCSRRLRLQLLRGANLTASDGRKVFAFRLHQFIAKGDRVHATLDPPDQRHITLDPRSFVAGSERKRALFPLAFCRACGQEYFLVRRQREQDPRVLVPRGLDERSGLPDTDGFLYDVPENPWPEDPVAMLDRVPESWVETRGERRILSSHVRERRPEVVRVTPEGVVDPSGRVMAWVPDPFRFCLRCGVEHAASDRKNFSKLATLGTEGRSTASTVLALSTLRALREDRDLVPEARKLLTFTDNRQDASLQAGHFNDFVEVLLVRAALLRATQDAPEGLRAEQLPQHVFDALALRPEEYAAHTDGGTAREDAGEALRRVLAHLVHRDLRRGWRITSPNLEQCGLLEIAWRGLDEVSRSPRWTDSSVPAVLATASPETRAQVCKTLLDHLRRELALAVEELSPRWQEELATFSRNNLKDPWRIESARALERSVVAYPRGRRGEKESGDRALFVSARGGFGRYLRGSGTFPGATLAFAEVPSVIEALFRVMNGGLLQISVASKKKDGVPGYQIHPRAMMWRAGDGTKPYHDPLRTLTPSDAPPRPNRYFTHLYKSLAVTLGSSRTSVRLEAHEHTAQVASEDRRKREEDFRRGNLPLLVCSPTMELGVDIADLNVVGLRNVPPTPANYAQRSGRAGREGQPAFVYTYCAAGSAHDQYFFRRPAEMVSGRVRPPSLDLTNENLLRAHVHAIWLQESGMSLAPPPRRERDEDDRGERRGASVAELLVLDPAEKPTLKLRPDKLDQLRDTQARKRAQRAAWESLQDALRDAASTLGMSPEAWLAHTLDQLEHSLDEACERWRGMYRAAVAQVAHQHHVATDASRTQDEWDRARRLRSEGERQKDLLLGKGASYDDFSDFYPYRYLASEGWLPGYNFPRLPLTAFVNPNNDQRPRREAVSRPRFLAIAEYGPRAILYHEGGRYMIHRVLRAVEADGDVLTRSAARCEVCGYVHPERYKLLPEICEGCGARLEPASKMTNLFPMRNVSTRHLQRISCDEEERRRMGYRIRTGVRFVERRGEVSALYATLKNSDHELVGLKYGDTATLWRINLGWAHAGPDTRPGFDLNVEQGVWCKGSQDDDETIAEDQERSPVQRVVPYVEDHRNALVFHPLADSESEWTRERLATLQAALKGAMLTEFQLEESELAVEPLPDAANRSKILFYEAAEGGAGVLRRVVSEPGLLPRLARAALERCHYNPDTGEDRGRPPGAKEPCEDACYDCLLSYQNQPEHRMLDRRLVRDVLLRWSLAAVETSPGPRSRQEHSERELRLTGSELERRWWRWVDERGFRLPNAAQHRIEGAGCLADFWYATPHNVAVFIDGPPHDEPAQRERDAEIDEKLFELGITPLRFHHQADWGAVAATMASVFGPGRAPRN